MIKIKQVLKDKLSPVINFNARRRLKNTNFTIISNNCWGGQVYQDLGIEYKSPFVGLFLFAPDYIKLLKDLNFYLSQPLSFIKESRYEKDVSYPVGLLDDIEIHFMHYESEQEAIEKWNRRLARMNMNNLFVKFSDRDLCTNELLETFDKLPFGMKICFTAKKHPDLKNSICFSEFSNEECVDNEISVYKKYFDVVDWLNNGQLPNTKPNIFS